MDSQSVNVIILPDEATKEKAVNLGKILAENFEADYTIADSRFIPHITIYQAQYPTKNYPLIKENISNIVKELKPFKVRVDFFGAHTTYIGWNIVKDKNLQQLHKKNLEILNPLREGLLLPHLSPDFSGYTSGEKFSDSRYSDAVRKYGAVSTGKMFWPHITIGKLKQAVEEENALKILPKTDSEFTVSELFIGKLGNYGTVTEILERFSFGAPGAI